MKVLKFKTNIDNEEMVSKLASFLDKEELVSKWNIETESKDNVLSVSGEEITPDVITKLVSKSGFQAEIVRVIAV